MRPPRTNSAPDAYRETVFLATFMCSIQTTFLNITAFDANIRIVYPAWILTGEWPQFNTIEAAFRSPVRAK